MYYAHLSAALDLVYHYQRVEADPHSGINASGFHANFSVDVEKIAVLVSAQLQRQMSPSSSGMR